MNCVACGKRFSSTEAATRSVARQAAQATREVHCHKCGKPHSISRFTRSTKCPTCQTDIVIGDLSLTTHAGQPIDLRGCLWIGLKASLAGQKAICTDAIVEGALEGDIVCENSLKLRNSAKLTHHICAKRVHVARDIRVELPRDNKIENLEIEGTVIGDVNIIGQVTILRTGQLLGNINARSVQVERGGVWTGTGKIGARD